jgi:murein DD-endopeptidase MepM/ murein hydrolase activator NlpD
MNYDYLPQPPEGVLNPKMPWSRINPNSRLWLILKSKLTGRRQGDESYTSYVNLSDADADRLIANIKKDPRGYPSLDQESGTPIQWMERQRLYQEWLVEAYLENPFREDVDKKIEEAEQKRRLLEIQEERRKAKEEQEEREKRRKEREQIKPPETPVPAPVTPAAPAPAPEPAAPTPPPPAPPKPKPVPLRDEDLVAPRQMPSNVSKAMAAYGDSLDAIGNELSKQNSIITRNLGYLRRIDEDLGDVEFLLGQMTENYQEALDDFESEERKKEARKKFVAKLTSPFKRKEDTIKSAPNQKPKQEKPWWNIWDKPQQKKLSSGGFLNTPYPAGFSRGGISYRSGGKNIIQPGIYDNPTQGELAPGTAVVPLNRNYGKDILGQYDLQKDQQSLAEVLRKSTNALLGGALVVYGSVLRGFGPLAGYFNISIPGLLPIVSRILGISQGSVMEMLGGPQYAGLEPNTKEMNSFFESWKDFMIQNSLKFLGGSFLKGGKKKKVELAGDILVIGKGGKGLAGMGGTNVTEAPAWIPYSKSDSGKIYYISGFGKRWGKDHTGIDLAPAGGANLKIISPFVGKVSDVNRNWPADGGGGYGNYVEIQHDNPKIFLFYGHLKDVADSIQPGAKVSPGQVIGTTGTTGVSEGVHLHWEVRLGSWGQRVDPVTWTQSNQPGTVNPPKKNLNDYPEYELDKYTEYDKGKIVRLGNKLYKINDRGALGDEVKLQSGGWIKPLANLVSKFTKPKGLSIKGVQAGFTGMAKQGFDAIMGGDKFRLGKLKPQILGRGAYSAPTMKGAQRYAGSSGSLGGKQTPGGVVKSIVPGNARRINFLEPQAAVKPATFDKGKLLADKLLQGAYANSPLANKLRMQLITGTAQNVGIGLGKLFGKALGVLNAPVVGDMIFPEATAPGTLDYARSQGWVTPEATKPAVKSVTMQMPSSPSISPTPQTSSKPQFVDIDIPTNTVLTTTQMRRM